MFPPGHHLAQVSQSHHWLPVVRFVVSIALASASVVSSVARHQIAYALFVQQPFLHEQTQAFQHKNRIRTDGNGARFGFAWCLLFIALLCLVVARCRQFGTS